MTFEKKIPNRMFCQICGQIHKIDFWVPDDIWKESIPEFYWHGPVCLNCFMNRADEKFIPWDKEIQFMPCSFYAQREIQIIVETTQQPTRKETSEEPNEVAEGHD